MQMKLILTLNLKIPSRTSLRTKKKPLKSKSKNFFVVIPKQVSYSISNVLKIKINTENLFFVPSGESPDSKFRNLADDNTQKLCNCEPTSSS